MAENPASNFTNKKFLDELLNNFKNFEYKLYGKKELVLHRGKIEPFEFDINLGLVHFTEQDFKGISDFVKKLNVKWGSQMTFCIYPSKEKCRDMIINVRLPGARFEID